MTQSANLPEGWVRRPNGTAVELASLPPRKLLAHELVEEWFPKALDENERLVQLKKAVLSEMRAYDQMMFDDYGVDVKGKQGGFSVVSADGTRKIELSVAEHVTFGPELRVARELINEFFSEELEGSSDVIKDVVADAFKMNSKGRVNTDGILGLRKHSWSHPKWLQAMDVIDDAICRDSATTYIRFYTVDPVHKVESIVPLSLAAA